MEVHFTAELQAKLESVAAENRRGADIVHDAWVRQKVTASLGKLDHGEFLTHEEVGARLQKKLQPQMQIRWSPDAATDLEGIVDYIRGGNPSEARRVGQEIYLPPRHARNFPV